MADKGGPDGICIAMGQNWAELSPTWTRIDDPKVPPFQHAAASPHNCNCASNWTVDRGRTYELNKTQTGTATITLQDPNGLFDPTNNHSPYFGKIGPMNRCSISLFNPNTQGYTIVFTGFIESWSWTVTQEEAMEIATINLVDGFDPLGRVELTPDNTGTTVVPGLSGLSAVQTTFDMYLEGTFTYTTDPSVSYGPWPDDGLAGPLSRWRNINSGNVNLQTTVYQPGSSLLSALQDLADAEFPGVANLFINKAGALTFYGRYPRFQPTNYPEDVNLWQVGDAGGADSVGAARIAVIEWGIDQTLLINACLCYYNLIPEADLLGQLYTDAASVTSYGYRQITIQDLIVFGQPMTPSQPAANAAQTCIYYAQYYVKNYSKPQVRISRLEFHSRPAGDSQTWAFLCGVEIGDLLSVFTTFPGGGGFGHETLGSVVDQFFVEGIHYQVAPNQQDIPDITMTLDVSPRGWFTDATWTGA